MVGQPLSNVLHQKVPASEKTALRISLFRQKLKVLDNCYLPDRFYPPAVDLQNLIMQLESQA